MKKVISALAFAGILGVAGAASASIMYTDSFYGSVNDNNYVDLWENQSVTLNFDITDNGYDPSTQQITGAALGFTIASSDSADETVRITAGVYDGNVMLYQQEFDLGDFWSNLFGIYKTASISLDLGVLGLLDYTQDGKFTTIVLSVNEPRPDNDSDFRLDVATFTATAEAVPEPTTMLLFGTGLAGLAAFGRRKNLK